MSTVLPKLAVLLKHSLRVRGSCLRTLPLSADAFKGEPGAKHFPFRDWCHVSRKMIASAADTGRAPLWW